MQIWIPIGPGELLDRISILKVKRARMTVPDKIARVAAQLANLEDILLRELADVALDSPELTALTSSLQGVNESLWCIEDELRAHEQLNDFGSKFVSLARSVYGLNDQRAGIKSRIDELLGSTTGEVKEYKGR